MEFEGIIVKDNPGLCRCCLSEGCYKDLSTEYIWMGESEVYADMLMECFDISISQHNDGPNGSSRLICEVCITRLRDACNFKKQVLESEKKFIDMLSRGELRSNVITYEQPMKEEIQVETVLTTDDEGLVEYLEDDVDYLGNNDDETNKERQKGETITTIVLQEESPSRLKQTASRTEKKKTVKKAVIKEGKIVKEKIEVSWRPIGKTKRDLEPLRRNIIEILKYTTVMPFKQEKMNYSNSYKCFFCLEKTLKPSVLRKHYREEHSETKYQALWDMRGFVYIDITDLNCKFCTVDVKTIDELIDHIILEHRSTYDKKCGRSFVPYRLTDGTLKCLTCDKKYNSFNPLVAHTLNEHIEEKPHLCDLCGKGFAFQPTLTGHMKTAHMAVNTHKCKYCGETFKTEYRKRSHENRIHREKTLKCPKCPEYFASFVLRKSHLKSVHREGRVDCEMCGKSYYNRNSLIIHIKSVHLNQKDVHCLICKKSFSDKKHMKNHMLTHSDERPYKCKVCKKQFKNDSNLRTHVRIHNDDRRFVCKICGSAFIQTSSLKYHMRKHEC